MRMCQCTGAFFACNVQNRGGNSSLMSAGFIWACVFSAASVPTIHIVASIYEATCQRPTLLRRMSGSSPCQIWKGSLGVRPEDVSTATSASVKDEPAGLN